MYSDQIFLLLTAIVFLLETAAICWVWERKMQQAEAREQKAEKRRKARSHDDYCTQEAARLYSLRRR